jgi:hypothetical protein
VVPDVADTFGGGSGALWLRKKVGDTSWSNINPHPQLSFIGYDHVFAACGAAFELSRNLCVMVRGPRL